MPCRSRGEAPVERRGKPQGVFGCPLRMPCLPTPLQKWPPSDMLRRGHDWPATHPQTRFLSGGRARRLFPRERSKAARFIRSPRRHRSSTSRSRSRRVSSDALLTDATPKVASVGHAPAGPRLASYIPPKRNRRVSSDALLTDATPKVASSGHAPEGPRLASYIPPNKIPLWRPSTRASFRGNAPRPQGSPVRLGGIDRVRVRVRVGVGVRAAGCLRMPCRSRGEAPVERKSTKQLQLNAKLRRPSPPRSPSKGTFRGRNTPRLASSV
jgi:hypothetical protein